MERNIRKQCEPYLGHPEELPPRAELTNDPELHELRLRQVTPREAAEEYWTGQEGGAFG